jgi:hypothetical protein
MLGLQCFCIASSGWWCWLNHVWGVISCVKFALILDLCVIPAIKYAMTAQSATLEVSAAFSGYQRATATPAAAQNTGRPAPAAAAQLQRG